MDHTYDPFGLYVQAQTHLADRRAEAAHRRLLDQLPRPSSGGVRVLVATVLQTLAELTPM